MDLKPDLGPDLRLILYPSRSQIFEKPRANLQARDADVSENWVGSDNKKTDLYLPRPSLPGSLLLLCILFPGNKTWYSYFPKIFPHSLNEFHSPSKYLPFCYFALTDLLFCLWFVILPGSACGDMKHLWRIKLVNRPSMDGGEDCLSQWTLNNCSWIIFLHF